MRKLFFVFYGLIVMAALTACGDEELTPKDSATEAVDSTALRPRIAWPMVSARFRMTLGETLMLVPDYERTDETTTYEWKIDGRVVGTADSYTFTPTEVGEFYVTLTVCNRYGTTTDEAKVTVTEPETPLPEIPEHDYVLGWRFPWTTLNIAEGRSVKVKAYMIERTEGCTYTWTLDGQPVEGLTDEIAFIFQNQPQGTHQLTLTLTNGNITQTQDFCIHVCPPAGTYQRRGGGEAMVSKIYEIKPAPGHQVNGYIIVGDSYPADCTHEQACDTVLAHFQRRWSISLGAQGGYVVAGFDHSVSTNHTGGYDLAIKGNPYDYQSEPGIVWVSQDVNGDGLPNDQWYELAGSEYGMARCTQEYAITYYRPQTRRSATAWRDCLGATGYVPYLSYWNPHDYYWQDWMEGTEQTFFGTRLEDRSTYENGASNIPPYDWGYADNLGSDLIDGAAGKMNYFRISQARTWDGQPANLEYIDFVKVQTAQTGATPNLGEISTEIYYIGAIE